MTAAIAALAAGRGPAGRRRQARADRRARRSRLRPARPRDGHPAGRRHRHPRARAVPRPALPRGGGPGVRAAAGRPRPAPPSTSTKLAAARDLVLVEGAGGLLVRYDRAGATHRRPGRRAARAGPASSTTAPALARSTTPRSPSRPLAARKIVSAGVVIGSWPARARPRRAREPDRPRSRSRAARSPACSPRARARWAGGPFSPSRRPGLSPSLGGTRGSAEAP